MSLTTVDHRGRHASAAQSLFSPRVSLRELALFCRRLALALEAGLDLRRILDRESQGRSSGAMRRHVERIRQEVHRGHSLSEAVAATGSYFPPLFHEMVDIGERTGKVSEVFRELADSYEYQQRLRREFLASIAWPSVQLVAAVLIVGLMIWVMGIIGDGKMDILGLGLVGTEGVVRYFTVVGVVVLAGAALVHAVERGVIWVRPAERAVLHLPVLGACLRTLALSRLAWSLHLTLETGMELERALPLSLRSTRNATFIDGIDQVVREVKSGHEISEALANSAPYPQDFLDTLENGERSGRLPEAMAILARQYQDQAHRSMQVLTTIAGFAVWALVALLIVVVIVRIFMIAYMGPINEALRGL